MLKAVEPFVPCKYGFNDQIVRLLIARAVRSYWCHLHYNRDSPNVGYSMFVHCHSSMHHVMTPLLRPPKIAPKPTVETESIHCLAPKLLNDSLDRSCNATKLPSQIEDQDKRGPLYRGVCGVCRFLLTWPPFSCLKLTESSTRFLQFHEIVDNLLYCGREPSLESALK